MKSRKEFDSEKDYLEYLKVYFAAMAMQGILASNWGKKPIEGENGKSSIMVSQVVEASIKTADELLNTLETSPTKKEG